MSIQSPPLLKAERATIAFLSLPGGKIRMVCSSWEDGKVALAGQNIEISAGQQGIEVRTVIQPITTELVRSAVTEVLDAYEGEGDEVAIRIMAAIERRRSA